MIKKLAHSALFIACAIRAHQTPGFVPWVDDGTGKGTLRPATSGECAAEACIHGAMLAQQIINSVKAIWEP